MWLHDTCACYLFLRAKTACFARLSHRRGVCPSVCLSHSWAPIKKVQTKITKSSLWAALRTPVFSWLKFRVPGWGGSPRTKASKSGTPPKTRYFAVIGSSSGKTVAVRYRHAGYHNKHRWRDFFRFINIDDIERPWTHKRGINFFRNFWPQRTFKQWIATKCRFLKVFCSKILWLFQSWNDNFPDLIETITLSHKCQKWYTTGYSLS